jgi:2-polyprenyl-3-methyl-5-hydroxy-6-metoxy-1,4-benzoquinol methylase
MHDDFKAAYESYLESVREKLSDEQIEQYKRFALSNRQRADDFISQLKSDTGSDLVGSHVLDIGSAYGGFVIQCAKEGAIANGVEVLPHLHALAQENARNESGRIELQCGNILDRGLLAGKKFELLIVNDVFEHIFDIELFFDRIAELSEKKATVYFAIPNGESYHSINREGHKFIFALSLLEPGCWGSVVGDFNIYYRPLDLYRYYFQRAGFKYVYVKVDPAEVDGAPERVQAKLDEIERSLEKEPFERPGLNDHVEKRFDLLRQKFDHDLKRGNRLAIYLKYEQYFWIGYGSRRKIRSPGLIRLSELV